MAKPSVPDVRGTDLSERAIGFARAFDADVETSWPQVRVDADLSIQAYEGK